MTGIPCQKRSSLAPLRSSERYASVGMLLIGAAMVSASYFTPAAAQNSQKIFEVPASKVRAMTPSEREQAKAYARQHGIRWRIVEGK